MRSPRRRHSSEAPDQGVGEHRSGHLFMVVLGLLVGALVASVVSPAERRERVVVDRGPGAAAAPLPERPVDGGDDGEGLTRAAGEGVVPYAAEGPVATSSGGAGTAPREVGTAGAGTDGGDESTVSARGVTDDKVLVGVAVPDLSALRHLGPRFDNGEPEEQWDALLEGWKRDGLVPVAGRDVEFVYRRYDVIDPASQRAACAYLVDEAGVFMVVGITFYYVGSECVAREKGTPLLTSDAPSDAVFERSHPYLFSLGMSNNRVVRNMIHMGHHEGILPGKTIGVYYENTVEDRVLVEQDIRGELEKLGYEIAAEHSTDQPLGGPQDAVAVQKFDSAGVDLAILLTSKAGFMQQAEARRYRPTYIESDHLIGTSDTTTSTYPPEQFDGTYALTGRRDGELNAGRPLTADRKACLDNFERHAGHRPTRETAEWAYVMLSCDEGEVLLHALQTAGRRLDKASFVAALETVRDMGFTRYLPGSFTQGKHHGGDYWRKLQWHKDCTCWHVAGEVRPLFVE